MEENLRGTFRICSLRLRHFGRYGGTTTCTQTCIFRHLLLSFNPPKNCQWYINIFKTEHPHKKWGQPSSLTHNRLKGRSENVMTTPPERLTSTHLKRCTSFINTICLHERKII